MKFTGDLFTDDSALEINVTPLIDVIFILLLFFILTTSFISDQAIAVKLPKAKSGTTSAGKQQVYIKMTKDGSMYLENEKISLKRLRSRLRFLAKISSQSSLTLEADTALDHGSVVQVMDAAREEGIDKIAIATEVKQ